LIRKQPVQFYSNNTIDLDPNNTMDLDPGRAPSDKDTAMPEQAAPQKKCPNRIPPKKKKGIGIKKKKGVTYLRWKEEQASLAAQPPPEDTGAAEPAPINGPVHDPAEVVESTEPKKRRSNDGWKVDCGIKSRDKGREDQTTHGSIAEGEGGDGGPC